MPFIKRMLLLACLVDGLFIAATIVVAIAVPQAGPRTLFYASITLMNGAFHLWFVWRLFKWRQLLEGK